LVIGGDFELRQRIARWIEIQPQATKEATGMYQMLLSFGHWLQNTSWALWIAGSDWAYPPVQALHFTGLSLWIATTAAIDMHMIRVGKKAPRAYRFSRALFVWNWIGLAIAVTGGFLLFSISAATYLANPAFEVKLGILVPLGLILHIFVQLKARKWSEASETPGMAKLVVCTELLVWFCVAGAAVSIPFF
jgi:hypothetical protein